MLHERHGVRYLVAFFVNYFSKWGISGEFFKAKIANKLNFNLLAIIAVPKKGTQHIKVVEIR